MGVPEPVRRIPLSHITQGSAIMKRALLIAAGVFLAILVLGAAAKSRADAAYFSAYNASAPFNTQVREVAEVASKSLPVTYQLINFTFDGVNGEDVPTLMTFPSPMPAERVPVIIFLHGIGQNKNFLKEITAPFNATGFAFVSFDQYMQGERKLPKDASMLAQVRAFRQRPSKTINETRRLVDYLMTHPQVDPQRVYLVGASYGAITGSTVLSFDKRIRAGVLVYGGGNIPKMLDAPLIRKEAGSLTVTLLKPVASYILQPADPINYVRGIAPTPVYFQNGKYDQLVSVPSSEALIAAAGEPKKVTWYESDHIGLDIENTKQVLRDALQWLLEQDDSFRTPEQKVKELPPFEVES